MAADLYQKEQMIRLISAFPVQDFLLHPIDKHTRRVRTPMHSGPMLQALIGILSNGYCHTDLFMMLAYFSYFGT